MFKIPIQYKLHDTYDMAIITQGKKILLYDDEPILYTGFNRYRNRILGSFLVENQKVKRFIHVILDEKEFLEFKFRKKTLSSIYYEKRNLFIIDISADRRDSYLVDASTIPKELFPGSESYCPKYLTEHSLDYSTSLLGNEANNHEADPEELSKVQTKIAVLLKSAIVNVFTYISPKISIVAHNIGSFQIQYKIELDPDNHRLFPEFEEKEIRNLLDGYLSYPIQHLPEDVNTFHVENAKSNIDILMNSIKEESKILPNVRLLKREKFIEKMINFSRKYEEICDLEKKHFTDIQISKITKNETIEPIAILDTNYGKKISNAIRVYETNSPNYETDYIAKEYTLLIYHINVETRKGNANLFDENTKKIFKPRIYILGTNSLAGTEYTKSLHNNKRIKVLAKATRFKKRIIYLEIQDTTGDYA